MPGLNQRVDSLSLSMLALLSAAACGPAASPAGETDAAGTGTGTGTGTGGLTEDPTTDPSAPTTTDPIPECQVDSDCSLSAYCNQCYEGSCRMNPVCDDSPYDPYCYEDRECGDGYICSGGECIESPSIVLPSCAPPQAKVAEWNLSNAPTAFVLADLDGDLDLDLAAAEPASGSIEIALNDGAGNFILAGAFGVAPGETGELALAAGDIDKDGDLDLVVTRREVDGVLNLLFNDGAVFTVDAPQFMAALPMQVFMADLDGDGALDVLTINEQAPQVTVKMGDGAGKLSGKQSGVAETITGRAQVTDIDGDGVADLLAPNPDGATLWIGGPKPLLSPLRTFPVEGSGGAALSGALDFEGRASLVFLHPLLRNVDQGMVEVWAGTAKGAWAFEPTQYITSQPLTGGVRASLDDSPGQALISATSLGQLMVLPSGFDCEHIVENAAATTPALIAVGDVDSDGLPDIVAGGRDGPTLTTIHLVF